MLKYEGHKTYFDIDNDDGDDDEVASEEIALLHNETFPRVKSWSPWKIIGSIFFSGRVDPVLNYPDKVKKNYCFY